MKKLILLALTALMIVGCDCETDSEIEEQKCLNGFNIVIIDSCEYIAKCEAYGNLGYGYFAHKGNCHFCQERRQRELEELIIKLKEK